MQITAKSKRLAERNGVLDKFYGEVVNSLIRKRYSEWDEIAIIRQRDDKPEEWAEYNAFCEECKKRAKEIMEEL